MSDAIRPVGFTRLVCMDCATEDDARDAEFMALSRSVREIALYTGRPEADVRAEMAALGVTVVEE